MTEQLYTDANKNFIIGQYLTDGRAMESKYIKTKNLYKFLDGIAKSFVLFEEDLQKVFDEMDPRTTEDLIGRWETEYGMAQSCYGIADTLDERRINILKQINLSGVQTIAEFKSLADDEGVPTILTAGIEWFSFPFDEPLFPFPIITEKQARFTLVVQLPKELNEFLFPFDITLFPFPFGSGPDNIIQCLFKKLVPCNVRVLFLFNL